MTRSESDCDNNEAMPESEAWDDWEETSQSDVSPAKCLFCADIVDISPFDCGALVSHCQLAHNVDLVNFLQGAPRLLR